MERRMLKVVGFDVGFPLSYSFLRRYAKVCKVGFLYHTAFSEDMLRFARVGFLYLKSPY